MVGPAEDADVGRRICVRFSISSMSIWSAFCSGLDALGMGMMVAALRSRSAAWVRGIVERTRKTSVYMQSSIYRMRRARIGDRVCLVKTCCGEARNFDKVRVHRQGSFKYTWQILQSLLRGAMGSARKS